MYSTICSSRLHEVLPNVGDLRESVLTYGKLSREMLLLQRPVDVRDSNSRPLLAKQALSQLSYTLTGRKLNCGT